ncbi:MAG TPA: TAXI family TRAP transporter solute-binding subunit [Stellaceae bacterium]|nr:TAXI family TRAP transporter solute-binding subunit [Stellaceae bacterium]
MILSCVRLASAWILASFVALTLGAGRVEAKDTTTQITVRAGKADNPNYVFARQFSEALALATNGTFALDVKESQGTVQNVIDAPKSNAGTIFTASRSVILSARRGHKPFTPSRGYYDIRALFPLPAQTVHWVVRQDSKIQSMTDLVGHGFIPGSNGSISQRVTASALQALGIERKVQLMDMDVAAAPDAVMSGKVSGLAVAGSFPIPRVTDIAKATPIRLLSLPPSTIAKMVAADDTLVPETIPKGTYPGVDADVTTVAVPTGIYTMRRMRDDTAYTLTKTFWSQLGAMASKNPAWRAITPDTLKQLGIKLHPGALRYYNEAGIAVPASLR